MVPGQHCVPSISPWHSHAYLLLSSVSKSGTNAISAADCENLGRDLLVPVECRCAWLPAPACPAGSVTWVLSEPSVGAAGFQELLEGSAVRAGFPSFAMPGFAQFLWRNQEGWGAGCP